MNTLCLPNRQIYHCEITGKFKAPSDNWKHGHFYLAEYELIVMTEGTLYLEYHGDRFTVKSGEYLLLPPCNSWRQGFRKAYCSFYWLHFRTEQTFLPLIVSPENPLPEAEEDSYFTIPQQGHIPKSEKVVILMKQLQDLVKSNYPTNAVDALATAIVTELYGQLTLMSPVVSPTPSQKQIYQDIIDYIHMNLSKNIRISDIATTFGYNEKYISHRFSEITGVPLKQYILRQKIDMANFMLTDSNKSISEISKSLGFPDSHNFARTYKKLTGLSPSEYRNAFSKRLLYDY